MWKVRELADKVTNVVMNYTEIEAKVREATNDDPWGPTGTLRHELAQATFSYDQFPEVMGMLWKRIAENKRSPRRIYKSLLLIHHLLLNGSDRVIRATTDRLYEIRQLQDYHVVYEPGFNIGSIIPVDEYKDGEINVRVKAKEIVELVQDEERLREERKKSKKNRDKYVGIGSGQSMSKWNDFDDDLQFPRQSSSKFDDVDGDDDKDSIGFTSKPKSLSNNLESPKSLNIKLKTTEPLPEDDFNPRAHESNSKTTVKSSTVDSFFGTPKADGGDFADFQSAFGKSESVNQSSSTISHQSSRNSSSAAAIAEDFFSTPTPLQNSTTAQQNSVDLLGLDISPSILQLPPAQNHHQQHVIATPSSNSSTISSSFDAFQGFQGVGIGNGKQTGQVPFFIGGGQTNFQAPSSALQSNFQNSQPQSTQHILFGGPSEGDNFAQPGFDGGIGLLQPQQVNNNINNNHVGATTAGKGAPTQKSLQGTTWSDLNFSLDDLSLSGKPQSTVQPSMNQLLSTPTRSKPF